MNLKNNYQELSTSDCQHITGGIIPLGIWFVGTFITGYTVQSGYWKR